MKLHPSRILAAFLSFATLSVSAADWWDEMDYGHFLSASFIDTVPFKGTDPNGQKPGEPAFADISFGPLPKDWAKYEGLSVSGDRVTFAYTVGAAHLQPAPTKTPIHLRWIPYEWCNPNGGQGWVTSDKWGSEEGGLIYLSYGNSKSSQQCP